MLAAPLSGPAGAQVRAAAVAAVGAWMGARDALAALAGGGAAGAERALEWAGALGDALLDPAPAAAAAAWASVRCVASLFGISNAGKSTMWGRSWHTGRHTSICSPA